MSSFWASHLVQKEEEYRKLNEEIQNQNKKLMKEFNSVMVKQDILLSESLNENKKPSCDFNSQGVGSFSNESLKSRRHLNVLQDDNADDRENINNDDKLNIPYSVDQMGVKGMTHFYRAKIKAMQNEYVELQQKYKAKSEENKKISKENMKLVEDKDKWFQAYNMNKTAIAKLENQISILNSKSQTKETENATLKKEVEQLKGDLKLINSNVSGYEIRLNRVLEENERMKNTMKVTKQEEKEKNDVSRKELVEISTTVKRLEKQKTELLIAFKKQMQLIDNLKKQKAFLEVNTLTQISENEFLRILDWKFDD